MNAANLNRALEALAAINDVVKRPNVKGALIRESLQRDLAVVIEAAELVKGVALNDYAADLKGFAECTRFVRSVKGQIEFVTKHLSELLTPIHTATKAVEQEKIDNEKLLSKALTQFNAERADKATAYKFQSGGFVSIYAYCPKLNVTRYQLFMMRYNGEVQALDGHAQAGLWNGKMYDETDSRVTVVSVEQQEIADSADRQLVAELVECSKGTQYESTVNAAIKACDAIDSERYENDQPALAALERINAIGEALHAAFRANLYDLREAGRTKHHYIVTLVPDTKGYCWRAETLGHVVYGDSKDHALQVLRDAYAIANLDPDLLTPHECMQRNGRPADTGVNAQIISLLSQGFSLRVVAQRTGRSKQHIINVKRGLQQEGLLK